MFNKLLTFSLLLSLLGPTLGRSAINVDGVLDEPEWDRAKIVSDFTVTRPFSLSNPPLNTEVRIAYTEGGIFVGFTNYQQILKQPPQTTLRDQDIQTDYNEVIVDFDGKGVRAFGFKVGRNGSIQDSVWSNENIESVDWDGDWLHETSVQEGHWTSELFIPWSLFSTAKEGEMHTIGLYLGRWHHGLNSRFSYPAIDRHQKSFVSRLFGYEITATPESSIDWFPYVSTTFDTISSESDYRTGLDVFWRPGSSQQLNISINPDYGQVESDDLVVNFSAIETFFEEKRPFFRENHELFDIRGPETFRAVHTPRIGGEPDTGNEDGNEVDAAARYSYVGSKIDLGALVASEDDARDSAGRDYVALRARYRWTSAQAGALYTTTDRPELNRRADVMLVDYQIDALETLKLQGLFVHSKTDNEVARSVSDEGWVLSAEWEATPLWQHEFTLFDYGDQLELNDLGFIKRVDREQFEYETVLEFPEVDASEFLRDAEASLEYQWKTNKAGDELPTEWGIGFEATTSSTSSWSLGYAYVSEGLDDLISEGNGNLFLPSYSTIELAYDSPPSGAVRLGVGLEIGESGYGGERFLVEVSPGIQLGSHLNLDVTFSYETNDSWVIYLKDSGLGEYDLEELTVAFNAYFVPDLSHEFRFKIESTAVTARGLRSIGTFPGGDPDFLSESPKGFSESDFAAQLRYRYEISALSELFVVYSRGGMYENDDVAVDLSRQLSRSRNARDSEAILFKLKLHF